MEQGRRIGMLVLLGVFLLSPAMADPIHDAAKAGNVLQVRQLLAGGAEVDAKAGDGTTPLHVAAFWGHTGVAEALIAKGADVNARSDGDSLRKGKAPLREAVSRGHNDVVELIRKHGAKE